MSFEVNTHAMFFLTKAAVPHMKPGSAIINTASVNSDMPNPILLAYATTKGATERNPGAVRQFAIFDVPALELSSQQMFLALSV